MTPTRSARILSSNRYRFEAFANVQSIALEGIAHDCPRAKQSTRSEVERRHAKFLKPTAHRTRIGASYRCESEFSESLNGSAVKGPQAPFRVDAKSFLANS